MTEITNTKPEPITAKPNWHYDSYFLSQLERLNLLHKPEQTTPPKKRTKVTVKTDDQNNEEG
jgi:hypothetical protein